LNAPRRRLVHPSHPAAAATTVVPWAGCTTTATPQKIAARTKEVSGPTTAIRKSAPGLNASPSSSDTPPKSHRVMRRTPIPSLFATTECDASCARRLKKNKAVATAPTSQ
jgi:hypothetical protein